jgi:hypothetical protein
MICVKVDAEDEINGVQRSDCLLCYKGTLRENQRMISHTVTGMSSTLRVIINKK